MNRIPRHVLRALEALAQSPINNSALAMAEATGLSHDTLYRALKYPLPFYFALAFEKCKSLGGLQKGFLIIDDVLIKRYRSGKMGLKRLKDTTTGSYVFGFSLVVLAWTDGKRKLPLAFLPYFADEGTKLELALALLSWAKREGFQPEGVLFDAWYAAKELLEWLQATGWPFVTRLRSNRLLDGVRLKGRAGSRWVKTGRLRGLSFGVGVVRRGGKFYCSSRSAWWGEEMVRVYRLRQGIEEIFRGLKQELGWVGPLVHGRKPVPKGIVHRHWRRGKVLGHLALGLVVYGLIEEMAHRLRLSFYQCRRKLMAGKLTLDLSLLLDGS